MSYPLPLILTELTPSDLYPTYLIIDVHLILNFSCYLHTALTCFFFFLKMQSGLNTHRFRAVSSEIQVWIVQVWVVPPFKSSFQQGFKNRNTDTWFASVIWVCTFCGTYISVSFGGVCIYCKKKLNFVYKNSISWCGSLWELVFLIGQLLMLCFPKKFQFTSGRLKSELAFLH